VFLFFPFPALPLDYIRSSSTNAGSQLLLFSRLALLPSPAFFSSELFVLVDPQDFVLPQPPNLSGKPQSPTGLRPPEGKLAIVPPISLSVPGLALVPPSKGAVTERFPPDSPGRTISEPSPSKSSRDRDRASRSRSFVFSRTPNVVLRKVDMPPLPLFRPPQPPDIRSSKCCTTCFPPPALFFYRKVFSPLLESNLSPLFVRQLDSSRCPCSVSSMDPRSFPPFSPLMEFF